jgi:glucose 1-dehydrogenase
MRLAGKTALVTGAAQGIGRGCALALARAGADVAVNDRERTDVLASLVSEISQLGRRVEAIEGDAFDPASCAGIVGRAVDSLGRLDILVSNPAYNWRGDFLDYPPETFQKVLNAVLFGGFCMSREVARHMVARGGGGKIVFVSSVHARIGYMKSVAYNAGKAGLNHMALTIAAELAPHRINVNVIEPGWIDTPGERTVFGDDVAARVGPTLPWGRMGTPDDIGKAAVYLASDDADYVTGSCLLVDGGMLLMGAKE